jgi:hypothetical protein
MPDHSIRDETIPGLSGSTDTPKYLPTAYASCREPIINYPLNPIGNRNSLDVTTFSPQINYGPVIVPTLDIS